MLLFGIPFRSLGDDHSTWPSRSVVSAIVAVSSLPLSSLDFLLANCSIVTSPLILAAWLFSFLSCRLAALSIAISLHFVSISFVLELSSLPCFRSSLFGALVFSGIFALTVIAAKLSDIEEEFGLASTTSSFVSDTVDDVLTTLEVGLGDKPPVLDRLNALSSRCNDTDTGTGTGTGADTGTVTLLERSSATLSTVDVIGGCDSAFPRLNDVDEIEIELGDEALGDFGEDACVLGGIRCTVGG